MVNVPEKQETPEANPSLPGIKAFGRLAPAEQEAEYMRAAASLFNKGARAAFIEKRELLLEGYAKKAGFDAEKIRLLRKKANQ